MIPRAMPEPVHVHAPHELSEGSEKSDTSKPERGERLLELCAVLLLSLTTVATAWSGYQASRWNGEQAKAAGRTSAIRIEAARAQGLAQAESQIDVATFSR